MIEFTTPELIAGHLKAGGHPDTLATQCAAAVNAMLQGRDDLIILDGDPPVETPTASAVLGATMLGARLHRRRNSPAGTEAVAGGAAALVAREDPDIVTLLRLDAPVVG